MEKLQKFMLEMFVCSGQEFGEIRSDFEKSVLFNSIAGAEKINHYNNLFCFSLEV